ncbi:hypothetical protein M422DRAFT_54782 [Sphaerobolus stellatus SS14]|uniref:DUF6533 domain-containing protein n=1 Tax=Sphaerobolus stellatus (strain SS14) TaxID=990650 RepID=A0A0C9US49_SPHS4|nr:hypothetical protein M422DRAFT_54782 [Sphaerobolus stellatus SS14]
MSSPPESTSALVYGSGTPSIVPSANVRYFLSVAASMVIFYDYALSFGDEVEFVWKARPNWVTRMYIFIRYFTIAIRIPIGQSSLIKVPISSHLLFCSNVFGVIPVSPHGCVIWGWFQVMTGQILFISVEILLIARVFAYYGRRKIVLLSLVTLLTVNVIASATLVLTSFKDSHFKFNDIPAFHAGPCIGHSIQIRYSSIWILPLSIHCIVILLVVGRFLKNNETSGQYGPARLLSLFVWDHTWAFVAVFAVSLWSLIAWRLPGDKGGISLTWNYSVLGYCGTRLILNLRTVAQETKQSVINPPTDPRHKFQTVDISRNYVSELNSVTIMKSNVESDTIHRSYDVNSSS